MMPGAKDTIMKKKMGTMLAPVKLRIQLKQAGCMFTEKCAMKQIDTGKCVRQ